MLTTCNYQECNLVTALPNLSQLEARKRTMNAACLLRGFQLKEKVTLNAVETLKSVKYLLNEINLKDP